MPKAAPRPRRSSSESLEAVHAPVPEDARFAQLVAVLQRGSAGAPAARVEKAPAPAGPPLAGTSADLLDEAERHARSSNIIAAVEICQGVEAQLLLERDARNMGRREYILLLAFQYAGRLKEAVVAGYKALEWYRMSDEASMLVRASSLLASVAARIGDGPAAIELLQQAGELANGPACTVRDRCIYWVNASDLQETLGNYAAAKDGSRQAYELAQEAADTQLAWVARANQTSSRLKFDLQHEAAPAELDGAIAALRRFVDDLLADDRAQLVPRLSADGAGALIGLGRLDEAQDLLRQGIQAADRVGALPEKGPLEVLFARICRLQGEPRSAHSHIAGAIELLTSEGRQDELARAHLENSLLHESQGKWRAALDSHRKYVEIWLSISKAQADARLEASHIRLELERSRREADALKREKLTLEHRLSDAAAQATDLKRLAMEDPLTALANRRRFFESAATLRGQDKHAMAVLMLDVDHFKQINDTHSHATGDLVLRELAALMRRFSRPSDVVARIGGEEFALLYGGNIGAEQARLCAERLRIAVQEHPWAELVAGLRVTVSAGLTPFHPDEAIDTALARADAALYASKSGGRNRTTCRDR